MYVRHLDHLYRSSENFQNHFLEGVKLKRVYWLFEVDTERSDIFDALMIVWSEDINLKIISILAPRSRVYKCFLMIDRRRQLAQSRRELRGDQLLTRIPHRHISRDQIHAVFEGLF